MKHVLDNPAWSALISGNKHLALGNNFVKYFDSEVSPFAGFKENTPENFQRLYELMPYNRPVLFVTPVEIEIPTPWKVINAIKGFQMVCETATTDKVNAQIKVQPLLKKHIPQMLALTQLTNPGPFASRTIDFGHYMGVFEGDKLVAMAGQRLHNFPYAEISAVCTHPDHLGKGYARELLIYQINRIKAAAEVPFLHVRYDNERAVNVYKSLGFSTRTEVYFSVMQKEK
jgi:ribosomal protein S18 acetylase RimI-like enzyme